MTEDNDENLKPRKGLNRPRLIYFGTSILMCPEIIYLYSHILMSQLRGIFKPQRRQAGIQWEIKGISLTFFIVRPNVHWRDFILIMDLSINAIKQSQLSLHLQLFDFRLWKFFEKNLRMQVKLAFQGSSSSCPIDIFHPVQVGFLNI